MLSDSEILNESGLERMSNYESDDYSNFSDNLKVKLDMKCEE
jgi:hypothetical protein